MDDTLLEKLLKDHEGAEQFAYKDSLGYLTIGIGRCIDRRRGKGLSPTEQLYLCRNDIADCKHELEPYSWYIQQDDVRKGVLIELCFNLGISGLLSFNKMLKAISEKNYKTAAIELLDSKWATQIASERRDNIHYRLLNGSYPS